MPRKEFQKDLANASTPGIYPHLSEVAGGDDDGSFVFVYTPPFSRQRVGIHATTLPECSDYPRKHQFFAFSGDDSIPDSVSMVLSNYQPSSGSPTIDQFLKSLSSRLNEAILNIERPEDASMRDYCAEEEADDGDDWDMNSVESFPDPAVSLPVLQSDVQAVKSAGYKVGCLGDPSGAVILSVSCRVKKLSLPSDVLRAWNVKESEYLVLLIRYPYGYCPMKKLIQHLKRGGEPLVEMNIGLCASYKPSLACALQQFTASSARDSLPHGSADTVRPVREAVYRSLLISNSINNLLNKGFLHLLKFRLDHGLSWRGAEDLLYDSQGKIVPRRGPADQALYTPDDWPASSPEILTADYLKDKTDPDDCSFPLAAIQFVLRRFAKCTEFCLNCHRKTESGFAAIKPYVCSDGLCLYQYISLGMGASLEWEILTQPYVVDLLISLTYCRAGGSRLTDFPASIGLTIPQERPVSCSFDPAFMTVHVDSKASLKPLKIGDCLFLKASSEDSTKLQWHCIVQNASRFPHVDVSNFIETSQEVPPDTAYENMEMYVYNRDFDLLTDPEKCRAIVYLLDTLPSVDQMRNFITNGPSHDVHRSLSSWTDQVSPSALYMLRWIVASNRSYIVHENDQDHMVSGMEGYTQFRIAQGAPDKEARFVQAVREASYRSTHKQKYPTLFAWHGSSVVNWHSILREGLHFKTVAHGRSQGDGVYMSPCFTTSIGYTGGGGTTWSRSKLKVKLVLSLNEVVNSPEEFLCSQNAYYVVNQLDWIQMRYLFVSSSAQQYPSYNPFHRDTADGDSHPQDDKRPSEVYCQDSRRGVQGPMSTLIHIPLSATKTHRKAASHSKSKNGRSGAKRRDSSDADSVATLEEDVALLRPPTTENGTFRIDTSRTDFRPGSVDYSSLKLLGEPKYATPVATRLLHRHLQEILKVQKTEYQHEMGWYIDPTMVNNVYQWIVELHSFDSTLPLAADLKAAKIPSIVTEIRFPSEFPLSPPFVRIIRPRLLGFRFGGGGHVTAGGSMCMELLTSSGWLATFSMENVLLQVRMALSNLDPQPARLDRGNRGDYNVSEAVNDFRRICNLHGWRVPADLHQISWS